MGREIRMVPPNWEHPKDSKGNYKPMFKQTFKEAAEEWKDGFLAWERGERPSYCSKEHENDEYWEYESSPPDREYYRPEYSEDPTWYQVYETVSEGTPVSPPFATQEELIDYLCDKGDYWCQKRPDESPPSREAATNFVKSGWAPSGVMTVSQNGVSIKTGINTA